MDFETLKKSGLLEQYVLGLTSRAESEKVEAIIQEDPRAQAELDRLQDEMNAFVEGYGMDSPIESRNPRRQHDFDDLDHEMIVMITERNHRLTIWRYVLGAVTLLLVCLCGYLIRLNQTTRAEYTTERARRAQDLKSHGLEVEKLAGKSLDWSAMRSIDVPAANGKLLFHYLAPQRLLLLDLSHTPPLGAEEVFYVFLGAPSSQQATFRVLPGEEKNLHPLTLSAEGETLRVYRQPANLAADRIVNASAPIATAILSEVLSTKE